MYDYNCLLKMCADIAYLYPDDSSNIFGCNLSDVSPDCPIFSNGQKCPSKYSNMPIIDNAPSCQYKIWTFEDMNSLSYMFDRGCSLREMCYELHRTPNGIAAKLVRLGKISCRKEILC